MDTRKMIADITSACTVLENEKTSLLGRVKSIEDQLTAYHMAIESLELTLGKAPVHEETDPHAENAEAIGHKTVLEFKGRKQTVVKWAKEMNITADGIVYRLKSGWTVENALTKPNQRKSTAPKRKMRKVFAYDSHDNVIRQYTGLGDASRDLRIPESILEKTISFVSKADQLANRSFYLAWAS